MRRACLLALLLAGCGGDAEPAATPAPGPTATAVERGDPRDAYAAEVAAAQRRSRERFRQLRRPQPENVPAFTRYLGAVGRTNGRFADELARIEPPSTVQARHVAYLRAVRRSERAYTAAAAAAAGAEPSAHLRGLLDAARSADRATARALAALSAALGP